MAVDEQVVSQDEAREETSKRWFVINTYSGYEDKVKRDLQHRVDQMGMADKIDQIIVPTTEEIEIRNGQRYTVHRKVYPGYVLVFMDMDDDTWYVVRHTPGVTSFVSAENNKPIPLDEAEVDRILNRMKAEPPKVKMSLRIGEAVRITDGPFADFDGTVDGVNEEKGKVRVLISIFGRATPVDLDFLQVEKIVP